MFDFSNTHSEHKLIILFKVCHLTKQFTARSRRQLRYDLNFYYIVRKKCSLNIKIMIELCTSIINNNSLKSTTRTILVLTN